MGWRLPSFLYFLAGQLVFVHVLFTLLEGNAAVDLEAAIVGSYEALMHLLLRGSSSPYPITTSMWATVGAWMVADKTESRLSGNFSPHSIVENPQLLHLYNYPVIWTKFGIKKVAIFLNGKFLQFLFETQPA